MSRNRTSPSRPIEADGLRARQAGPLDQFIGAMIQERRRDRPMGSQQLAKMLGFSYQQIRKYELGLSRVPASTLYVIAQILDVPIGDLLPDDRRMLDPLQQCMGEITTKLSAIEDRRFQMAISSFLSAAVD